VTKVTKVSKVTKMPKVIRVFEAYYFLRKCCRMPRPVDGDECSGFEFDRQDILVLPIIFAEAGKPRLSVKPRLVGGELHFRHLET